MNPPSVQDAPSVSEIVGEQSSPGDLIRWCLIKFSDQPIVMTTSYGMEGCVLLDLCSKAIEEFQLPPLTIASIDTGFFFPQTIELKNRLIDRYPNLNFVTWQTNLSVAQQAEIYGDELWKNNPNMCCHLRKVVPMQENIGPYKVWITGVRRSQTEQRSGTPVMGWDWRYQLLKFCPLVSWNREQVWQYIQQHKIPFNELHLEHYPSVGCTHCTKPVPGSSPQDDARGGRWAGQEKTECGLHYSI